MSFFFFKRLYEAIYVFSNCFHQPYNVYFGIMPIVSFKDMNSVLYGAKGVSAKFERNFKSRFQIQRG